jgi:glutaredoxin
MKYYKIICWSECPFCLQAKMVMIGRPEEFEYCSVNHSPRLLDHYKSIYKHETVPMIVEIDISTSQERFIGGYTDLIKYFKETDIEAKIFSSNGKS